MENFEGELGASVLDAQKVSPSVCPPLFCQWPIGRDEGGRKSSKCQLNTELLSRFPLNMSAAKRHQHKKNSNFKYLALFSYLPHRGKRRMHEVGSASSCATCVFFCTRFSTQFKRREKGECVCVQQCPILRCTPPSICRETLRM